MLISDSRFDLVWFRLSCDHGWIRSGSVNVRKQQQQQQSKQIVAAGHSTNSTFQIRPKYILLFPRIGHSICRAICNNKSDSVGLV